jgi:hypothetical protein
MADEKRHQGGSVLVPVFVSESRLDSDDVHGKQHSRQVVHSPHLPDRGDDRLLLPPRGLLVGRHPNQVRELGRLVRPPKS